MNSAVWKTYNNLLQMASMAFGFLLMLGLSLGGSWASFLVVFLMIALSSAGVFLLKKIKGLDTIHWLGANWTLLAGSFSYILTNNEVVKVIMFLIMTASAYIILYRACYYEKISVHHVKCILGDLPILSFYYLAAFFKRNETAKSRMQRKKRVNGFCILFIVLGCIFLPLYTAVDDRIVIILCAFAAKFISTLPIWVICALLGLIPAVVNYSIIRGLACDIVLKNPERNYPAAVGQKCENQYMNETVAEIILWGLIAVNVIFAALQISYLLQVQESQKEIESLHSMQGGLPLLAAIGAGIVFVAISGYLLAKGIGTQRLSQITFLYILSLIGLLLLVVYRYILKAADYGIGSFDIIGIIGVLLLGLLLVISLRGVMLKGEKIVHKLALWGTVCFVAVSLLPIEYFLAQINVHVFLRRYQNEEFVNRITEEDIDLEFLREMKYDAVPALVLLMDIPLTYGETNQSMGETVKDTVVEMFYADMSEKEIEEVGELKTEKEMERFQDIMSKKVEYSIIGRKKMAYRFFCEAL